MQIPVDNLLFILCILAVLKILNRFANRLPLTRAIQWTHAMAFEILALIWVFLSRPIKYLKSYQKPAGSSQGRPILLVHGYINDSSVWIYQRRQLAKAGYGPIYTINLGYPFRSIRDYAEKVKAKADEIERETGKNELILISHSMGGLVSLLYASRLAPKDKVTDLITIGSPLNGTCVAHIGIGRNAREMETGSELIRDIQEVLNRNASIRLYHIGTRCDQLVVPYTSSLPSQNSERQYVIDDLGHASLLYSKRVANKLCEWLSKLSD